MRAMRIVVLVALAVGVPAGATDLELQLEGSGEYDSNVVGGLDDFSVRLIPRIRILDESGKLEWELRYAPRYRKFHDLDEFDGWDHDAYGRLLWSPSARTSVHLSGLYFEYSGFDQFLIEEVIDTGAIETSIELGRQRVQQTVIDGGISHYLAKRHLLGVSFSLYDTEYEEVLQSDIQVDTASLSYFYILDPTDRFGLLVRATQQVVGGIAEADDLTTDFYNLSLQWAHSFSPTFSLDAWVGPTWVKSELAEIPDRIGGLPRFPLGTRADGGLAPLRASSCPRLSSGEPFLDASCEPFGADVAFSNPFALFETTELVLLEAQDDTADDLTYFANIELKKVWEAVTLTLRYGRDVSTTTQAAGVVRDELSAKLSWLASERVRLTFDALYEMREQSVNGRALVTVLQATTLQGVPDVAESIGFKTSEVDREIEINRIWAGVYAQYYATKHTTFFANVFWTRWEVEGTGLPSRVSDRFGVRVGVRYTFDRFHLPI